MNEVKTEVYTTYDAALDRTVVWQDLVVGDLCVQTAILGWYYGKPNNLNTTLYSNSRLVAQYV